MTYFHQSYLHVSLEKVNSFSKKILEQKFQNVRIKTYMWLERIIRRQIIFNRKFNTWITYLVKLSYKVMTMLEVYWDVENNQFVIIKKEPQVVDIARELIPPSI